MGIMVYSLVWIMQMYIDRRTAVRPAAAGLLKLGPAHLTTESISGIYISARNLSLEARRYLDGKGGVIRGKKRLRSFWCSKEDVMNCTSTSSCNWTAFGALAAAFNSELRDEKRSHPGTFNANAATSAVFLCPSGAGSVAFEDLHDFGCLVLLACIRLTCTAQCSESYGILIS